MNRIYKVIWSKVKNCYIVVSEIAKSHSKPISTKLNSGKRPFWLLWHWCLFRESPWFKP